MDNSLTIVIPNRNRDLETVRRSLSSIVPQLNDAARLVIVDYGSAILYQTHLKKLISTFSNIELILCPTQGQLWNKSRCINIVLKTCTTTHLMVCDMDMLWHPTFLKNNLETLSINQSVYFTVGIMTQEESAVEKAFKDYAVKFQTNQEATGISIFPVAQLKSINGFDEFYHGWGSEDTDVHVRLRNAGYQVRFRESEIYFKHQWHAKAYRSKDSSLPFHNYLERINQKYVALTTDLNKIYANAHQPWGQFFDSATYKQLHNPGQTLTLCATEEDLQAFVHYLNSIDTPLVLQVKVTIHPQAKSLKTRVKKSLGKKTPRFISMDRVNEILLESIVLNHSNCPYDYSYDRKLAMIVMNISTKISL